MVFCAFFFVTSTKTVTAADYSTNDDSGFGCSHGLPGNTFKRGNRDSQYHDPCFVLI
jgi:hypothetical protein